MSACLLDTSVLIDISKGREPALRQLRSLLEQGAILGLCGVNLAEFYSGVAPGTSPEMDRFLASLRLWPVGRAEAVRAAGYRRAFRRRGIQLSTSDTLIAGVARERRAAVMTGNVRHFPMEDLRVIAAEV